MQNSSNAATSSPIERYDATPDLLGMPGEPLPEAAACGPRAVPATEDSLVKLARRVSDLLSPPMVAVLALSLLAVAYGGDSPWRVFLIAVLVQTVLPIAVLKLFVSRGLIGDVDMSERAERRWGLPLLAIAYLAGTILVLALRLPPVFVAVCLFSLAVIAAIWVVNLVYKASGHMAGVAAYITVMSLFGPSLLHPGLLLLPILAWARVKSGAHTVAQTIWGALIGTSVTWAMWSTLYQRLFIG